MFFKKQGFPEEGELVLCTVNSVQYHSVFVDIDEYKKGGMIHISEVSPGRIRNIRDFVKEGKKIVCKVLRINEEKGYIDLSLRRVNESEKRKKIEEIKREQNAEKIVEITSSKLGIKNEEFYTIISEKIFMQYKTLNACFDEFIKGNVDFEKLGIPPQYTAPLAEAVKQRVKLPEVAIGGKLKIATYAPNGAAIIKDSIKKIEDAGKGNVNVFYLGSGTYRVLVKAADYKEAEKILKEGVDAAVSLVKKQSGEAEFIKDQ